MRGFVVCQIGLQIFLYCLVLLLRLCVCVSILYESSTYLIYQIAWSTSTSSSIKMSDSESSASNPKDALYESIHNNRTSDPQTPMARTPTHKSTHSRRGSNTLQNIPTHLSHKETRDPNLDINLPYRTLSPNANLSEYTTEKPEGEIPSTNGNGKIDYKLVTFLPDDPENPKNWSKAFKWYITMVVASTCFVVALASSIITADLIGVEEEFNVSEEVALVSITVFVMGFGIGRLFLIF